MSKAALAQMLREFPTWGDAALHYKAENERLREAAERVAFWHEDRIVPTEECPDYETALHLLRDALKETTGQRSS